MASALRPDVVLMDISMPRMDGLEATRIIRRKLPETHVVIISQNDPALVSGQASSSGAQGFIAKTELSRKLMPAIDEVALSLRYPGRNSALFQGGDRAHLDPIGEIRLRDALDALPAAVYITDARGRLTYFNSSAIDFSGRIPEIGSDRWCVTWKLYRPDGTPLPHDECPMAITLKEGCPVRGDEAIAERSDGTRRWFTSFPSPLRDTEGNIVGGINLLLDITERKRQEQTSNLLAAIVDSSDDAIISKNLNGIITSWNNGAQRMFGYSVQEAIGQHITLIVPADRLEEERDILARLGRGERIDHFDTIRRTKDGSLLDMSLTISPVKDGAGRIIGASKVARDISRRKRTEQALADVARQQRALFYLADGLHRAATLEDVCNVAMNSIAEAVQSNRESILLSDEKGVMRFVAWRGLSETYRQMAEGYSPWVAGEQNLRPVIIENIDSAVIDARIKQAVKAEAIASLAFIPLVSQNGVIGRFMTYFSEPHRLAAGELELCTTIATQVSFAIERKRAADELRSSEERFRNLSAALDAEVRARTRQVEKRNTDLLRQSR
jgi:PAS domain S-box-containing protein